VIVVAGAGWSGAVIARRLAEAGLRVTVYEARDHVGGNCATERRHGINVHMYGPHIFHTGNERVWDWVQDYGEWVPFRLKVLSVAEGGVYSLPVNLHTINQVFGTAVAPRNAERLLELGPGGESFEDAAIGAVGERIYRLLFEGYTRKQWGVHPRDLPAETFKRLPVRYSYDDNYFTHKWQAIPRCGYTPVFERILDHPNIAVELGTPMPRANADHTFWTGPLDAYFGHDAGRLRYRTLRFQHIESAGDWQGAPLVNYPDISVPWTRSTEHKHLAPWETHDRTVVTREVPDDCGPGDEPFYPTGDPLASLYRERAGEEPGVTFLGRLGTCRYLDMDVTIAEALDVADRFLGEK
jgi:UDP-galactopyranose mutase